MQEGKITETQQENISKIKQELDYESTLKQRKSWWDLTHLVEYAAICLFVSRYIHCVFFFSSGSTYVLLSLGPEETTFCSGEMYT